MDLDGSFMRSMVCCHVGRPTTFLNAVVAAAFTAEAAMVARERIDCLVYMICHMPCGVHRQVFIFHQSVSQTHISGTPLRLSRPDSLSLHLHLACIAKDHEQWPPQPERSQGYRQAQTPLHYPMNYLPSIH